MDIGEPQKVVEVEEPAVPYRGDEVPEKDTKRPKRKEPAKT